MGLSDKPRHGTPDASPDVGGDPDRRCRTLATSEVQLISYRFALSYVKHWQIVNSCGQSRETSATLAFFLIFVLILQCFAVLFSSIDPAIERIDPFGKQTLNP